ncbi:MAG: tetratricopeptide repeat protein, partial [Terriglobia bacterium]
MVLKLTPRRQTILAGTMVVVWMLVMGRFSQMDSRFFQPSVAGAKGLVLYLFGDYDGAAAAYRAHYQDLYRTERMASDPAWEALLNGDLNAAETLAKEELSKNSQSVSALLTLGEIALEQGDPHQALDRFNTVLRLERDQYDALLLSSVAHVQLGDNGAAIDAMNRALRHDQTESRITTFFRVLSETGHLSDLSTQEQPFCLLAHYYRYLRIFDHSNARLAVTYAKKAIAAGDHP